MISLKCGQKTVSSENQALIMGIVNATPDSFFSKSRGGIERALQLIDEGADIIDIGGESTRPGFKEIDSKAEIQRIIPVIKAIRRKSDIPISVDTRKKDVLQAAVEEGADILNDVSSFETDSSLASYAALSGVSVVLMQGYNIGENHESSCRIVENVQKYLAERVEYAISQGIDKSKIILDPGIGFGKTEKENIELIKNVDKFCSGDFPVLMALSRKRIIGTMTKKDIDQRLPGTLAANIFSVLKGVKILRVHDVKETLDTLNVMKYLF